MYENFGAFVDDRKVTFSLFFPGRSSYVRGGGPHIRSIRVIGDFQEAFGGKNWSSDQAEPMEREENALGTLFHLLPPRPLPQGNYRYQYQVEFENGSTRLCADPCAKLGAFDHESSAFIIGGTDAPIEPLKRKIPLSDLIIYEMNVYDFTERIPNGTALGSPIDAVRARLDYLRDLGVNAIQFMPLTAWSGDAFSWGYEPSQLFSIESGYVNTTDGPFQGLHGFRLLLSEMHARGMMALFDGVFNHVRIHDTPGKGFPYFWLYQDPEDSPFVGRFGAGGFFKDLDFNNACTQKFVADVCRYWMREFRIDGIRLDYSRGYLDSARPDAGVPKLCADIATAQSEAGDTRFEIILEHLTDDRYDAIAEVNSIKNATGCWFDPLMFELRAAAVSGRVGPGLFRAFDTARDFAHGKSPVVYVENHDHSSLMHALGGKDVWWRVQPCLIALFTVPGAVLFYQGAEMGNDFRLPDRGHDRVIPRPLNWEQLETFPGDRIHRLFRDLISLRKTHPALRSGTISFEKTILSNPRMFAENGVVIFHRWTDSGDYGKERIVVALNFSNQDRMIDLCFPYAGMWRDLLDTNNRIAAQQSPIGLKIASNWGSIYLLEP
jgi:pullulanase